MADPLIQLIRSINISARTFATVLAEPTPHNRVLAVSYQTMLRDEIETYLGGDVAAVQVIRSSDDDETVRVANIILLLGFALSMVLQGIESDDQSPHIRNAAAEIAKAGVTMDFLGW